MYSGGECAVVRNEEVEVVVPAHLFSHVYGKDGDNLALLKQVSLSIIVLHRGERKRNRGGVWEDKNKRILVILKDAV